LLTLGIDLASQPKGTAACLVSWARGTARAFESRRPADDATLLELAERADKVGIDVPLGWPDEFVAAVGAHSGGAGWPEPEDRRLLRFRATDLAVWSTVGRPPLSVSADRIALCAMRAARLLSRLEVDRAGSGKVVEVYPAAALRRWGVGRDEIRGLPWLGLEDGVRRACEESGDVADALVAALVARAAALGLCEPVPEELRERASREGWIALPLQGSLGRLPG
jgi:predicted nuclease with RNAse H fold